MGLRHPSLLHGWGTVGFGYGLGVLSQLTVSGTVNGAGVGDVTSVAGDEVRHSFEVLVYERVFVGLGFHLTIFVRLVWQDRLLGELRVSSVVGAPRLVSVRATGYMLLAAELVRAAGHVVRTREFNIRTLLRQRLETTVGNEYDGSRLGHFTLIHENAPFGDSGSCILSGGKFVERVLRGGFSSGPEGRERKIGRLGEKTSRRVGTHYRWM